MPVSSSGFRIAILAAVVVVTAAPAQAQLGGLVRRAAERRVEQKAEDRIGAANLIEPTFDATTIEITAARLDRYTAAMETLKRSRAANRQRYDALQTQRAALLDSASAAYNKRDAEAYQQADSRYGTCRSEVRRGLDAESEKKMAELQARMQRDPIGSQNDPQVKAFVAAMQEMAQAQQRGDTAASARSVRRMQSMVGGTADSLATNRAVVAKCGALPAKPASMVREEGYRKRAAELDEQARALLSVAGGVKGTEVGMTDAQARMLWERIQSWLNGVAAAPITRTFLRAEYDLLVARRNELKRAFSGIE